MTRARVRPTDVIILRRHGVEAIERGGTAFWEIFRCGVVELSSIRTYEEARRCGERLTQDHRVALLYRHTPTQPNPRTELLANFAAEC